MKTLFLFTSIIFMNLAGFSQVIADPATDNISVTNTINIVIDPRLLVLDSPDIIKVPILNLNVLNGLPFGTCKVKIGLGSKLIVDPTFDLTNTSSAEFFNWSVFDDGGGQIQVIGDLKKQVPANYSGIFECRVLGSKLGSSTITTNFQVTNHNTTITLSDENPNNNSKFLGYTIVEASSPPLPVNFTNFNITKTGCDIKVIFSTEAEINVDHFEVEISKDGRNFTTIGEMPAKGNSTYAYSFKINNTIEAPFIFIRIKSVDIDGKLQLTATQSVAGNCAGKLTMGLYPNPLEKNSPQVTIKAKEGLFNGKLNITLMDVTGKVMLKEERQFLNANSFTIKTGGVAPGFYIVKILTGNTAEPTILNLIQL